MELFRSAPGYWGTDMHYVLIALVAVVVVVLAWIAIEAEVLFRRRSRVAHFQKSEQLE